MCDVATPLYRAVGEASLNEVPDELNYTCQLPDVLNVAGLEGGCVFDVP